MALPDLTGLNIQDTYQRLLQRSSSGDITDGTGSLYLPPSASFAISASYAVSSSHEIIKEISSSHANIADNLSLGANINIGNITASSDISSSGAVIANSFTGNGLSIDGPSNSHIEVGEYPVGYDLANLPGSGLVITGSGLIISGAMADANHHNMLKIGNVELIDLNTSISTNEFLIHNVASFKMTSGSDGGDVANSTGVLLEHNGSDYKLYKNNTANITSTGTTTTISDTDILINAANGPIFRALNSTTSTYLAGFDGNPDPSATQNMRSISMSSIYPLLGGAVTASAVSASGTITATLFVGEIYGGSF